TKEKSSLPKSWKTRFMKMHLKKKTLKYLLNNAMRLTAAAVFTAILFVSAGNLQAQTDGFVVDEIVAKVDNYIVLKSEVDRMYQDYLTNGTALPSMHAAKFWH